MKSSLIFILLACSIIPYQVTFAGDSDVMQLHYSPVKAEPSVGAEYEYSFPVANPVSPPKRDSLTGKLSLDNNLLLKTGFDQSTKVPLRFRGVRLSECDLDVSQIKEDSLKGALQKVKRLFKKLPRP